MKYQEDITGNMSVSKVILGLSLMLDPIQIQEALERKNAESVKVRFMLLSTDH
jgi:hypothetical protein